MVQMITQPANIWLPISGKRADAMVDFSSELVSIFVCFYVYYSLVWISLD